MDGVVADLHTEWLNRYNHDYSDTLKPGDITMWDISRFVKPECGAKIWSYLHDPTLYDTMAPVDGALAGIKSIRAAGIRVVFVTSANTVQSGQKLFWLARHGFLELLYKSVSPDYVVAHDKSLMRADYMLDDHRGNLDAFKPYGKTLLFSQPHNIVCETGMGWHERVWDWVNTSETIIEWASEGQK